MFYDKLNSDIKMMMVHTFAEGAILETDTELEQLQKYSNLVATAQRIESIRDKGQERRQQEELRRFRQVQASAVPRDDKLRQWLGEISAWKL